MKKIAVVIHNNNENVTVSETIDAIKKQDLKMFLFNGITRSGNIVKKSS